MRAVGIEVLKSKPGEYVRLAASGEIVPVTDRDRVVAELVPLAPGRSPLRLDAMSAGRGYPTETVDLTTGVNLVCMFRAVLRP